MRAAWRGSWLPPQADDGPGTNAFTMPLPVKQMLEALTTLQQEDWSPSISRGAGRFSWPP